MKGDVVFCIFLILSVTFPLSFVHPSDISDEKRELLYEIYKHAMLFIGIMSLFVFAVLDRIFGLL